MKPQGFFANVVRALCIPYQVDAKNASKIVTACSGVRRLACWVDSRVAPDLPLLISRLPLTRLDIEFEHFLEIPLDTSIWRSTLTHLGLTFWDDVDDPVKLSPLGWQLSRLTHVTMASGGIELARALCSSYPNLQVVRLGPYEDIGEDEDPRIVLLQPATTSRDGGYGSIEEWVRNLP
ncbi:hypothetical protein C8J57DRAFT_1275389 [Mycena rebaudengoi]|nr:hypothetical protein C8J57DRAFT_1275389 [Mycena rebaudengoi]